MTSQSEGDCVRTFNKALVIKREVGSKIVQNYVTSFMDDPFVLFSQVFFRFTFYADVSALIRCSVRRSINVVAVVAAAAVVVLL